MMATSSACAFFFFALLVISASAFSDAGSRRELRFTKLKRTATTNTTTTTHIRMYLHDTLTGPNATAVRVVRGPGSDPSPSAIHFGDVVVMDDPLTEGPEADSRLVARAQGFYVLSAPEGLVLQVSANVVFAPGAGEYVGSTLVLAGSDPLLTTASAREYAVVGGTGRFRGARGYVLEKTVALDPVTGDGVFELDVYVDT